MASKNGRSLTLAERVAVVRSSENGHSCRKIARDLGVGKTQVQRIILQKSDILTAWTKGESLRDLTLHKRKTKHPGLNSTVWDWFREAKSRQLTVSGKQLQEKAREVAHAMGYLEFAASNGWLASWRKHYGLLKSGQSGQTAHVQHEVGESAPQEPQKPPFECQETLDSGSAESGRAASDDAMQEIADFHMGEPCEEENTHPASAEVSSFVTESEARSCILKLKAFASQNDLEELKEVMVKASDLLDCTTMDTVHVYLHTTEDGLVMHPS